VHLWDLPIDGTEWWHVLVLESGNGKKGHRLKFWQYSGNGSKLSKK